MDKFVRDCKKFFTRLRVHHYIAFAVVFGIGIFNAVTALSPMMSQKELESNIEKSFEKWWAEEGAAQFRTVGLTDDEKTWLDDEIARSVEEVRLDARGVQRALAARLQRQWIENPSALGDIADPSALADALKAKSLKLVAEATGAEVLP